MGLTINGQPVGQNGQPISGGVSAAENAVNDLGGGGGGFDPISASLQLFQALNQPGGTGPVLTGGVSGGGGQASIVAPQEYNYGPFGLLTKKIPGAIAAPEATYAPTLQFTQPNVPTIGQPQVPQLLPMQTPQVASAPHIASPSAYAAPQQMQGQSAPQPLQQAPQSPLQPPNPAQYPPELQGMAQNPLYAPDLPPPPEPAPPGTLQGYVQQQAVAQPAAAPAASVPVQAASATASPDQTPLQHYVQQAMEATGNALSPAAGALGDFLGLNTPAEAAQSNGELQAETPKLDVSAQQRVPVIASPALPNAQHFQNALNRAAEVVNQASGKISDAAVKALYSAQNEVLRDYDSGQRSLDNVTAQAVKELMQPYTDYENKTWNNPIPGLGPAGIGRSMTLEEYRDHLNAQASTMTSQIHDLISPVSPDRKVRAESLYPQIKHELAGARALMETHGPISFFAPGINKAATQLDANDAKLVASMAEQQQYQRDLGQAKILGPERDKLWAQAHKLNQERDKFQSQVADAMKLAHLMSIDANKNYNDHWELRLKALSDAGNHVVDALRIQLADDTAKLETARAEIASRPALMQAQVAMKKLGLEEDALTHKIMHENAESLIHIGEKRADLQMKLRQLDQKSPEYGIKLHEYGDMLREKEPALTDEEAQQRLNHAPAAPSRAENIANVAAQDHRVDNLFSNLKKTFPGLTKERYEQFLNSKGQ